MFGRSRPTLFSVLLCRYLFSFTTTTLGPAAVEGARGAPFRFARRRNLLSFSRVFPFFEGSAVPGHCDEDRKTGPVYFCIREVFWTSVHTYRSSECWCFSPFEEFTGNWPLTQWPFTPNTSCILMWGPFLTRPGRPSSGLPRRTPTTNIV